MQPLQDATTARALPQVCARSLLGGVHVLMGFIRLQMRSNRGAGLSVPHFRALILLSHAGDASVSALAEHVGLSLPAASRLADVLVRRGLLTRQGQAGDRRRVLLSLTPRGRTALEEALAATETALAVRLTSTPRRELSQVIMAMRVLDRVFSAPNGDPKR